MKDLAAEDVTTDVQGWLQWARAHFLQLDLFESVPASDTLMRIHSTAEEFDSTAEDFLAPFQVIILVNRRSLLSLPFMPGSVPPYMCLFCKQDGPFASKKVLLIFPAISNFILAHCAAFIIAAAVSCKPCLNPEASLSQPIAMLVASGTLYATTLFRSLVQHKVPCIVFLPEKNRKEKTTPFGINVMTSQISHQAAQVCLPPISMSLFQSRFLCELMSCCVLQITLGVFLSLASGANSAHTSFGILAMMRQIQKSGTLSTTASLGIRLRCISALGTAIGTLLWGKRLAPITGAKSAAMVA